MNPTLPPALQALQAQLIGGMSSLAAHAPGWLDAAKGYAATGVTWTAQSASFVMQTVRHWVG